jgi:hypothetical protein
MSRDALRFSVARIAVAAVAMTVVSGGCAKRESAEATATTTATVAAKPSLPPPTADAARALIAASPEFSEYQFTNAAYTLPMKRSAMNAPALAAAKELAAAKWISFRGDEVVLQEKATSDRRFLVRPNGTVDIVPLAKKELVAASAVRPLPDGNVAVDFDWKWTVNEIGAAFRSGALHDRYAAPQQATATLLSDGTSWSVLKIEPR